MSPEYIKEVLQKIRTEYNIDDLANYRAFFKKHVPFFMRSWFAAALMLELDASPSSRRPSSAGGRSGRSAARPSRQEASGTGASSSRKTRDASVARGNVPLEPAVPGERNQADPSPRVIIPEDEASTLFFSAGRKRRVYPRDIVGFVLKESSVDREDIGDIRILDNFSFIQVRKTVADTLISELNEKPFRGRNLTVSYAKPRPDPDSGNDGDDIDKNDSFETGNDHEAFDNSDSAVATE